MPSGEYLAIQRNFVLIGSKHRPRLPPEQQSLYGFPGITPFVVESAIINQVRTETSSGFIDQQPAVASVHFCHRNKLAFQQFAPTPRDVIFDFAKAKHQIGRGALDTMPGLTNMETAEFFQ